MAATVDQGRRSKVTELLALLFPRDREWPEQLRQAERRATVEDPLEDVRRAQREAEDARDVRR
jgi:hypothetical protein